MNVVFRKTYEGTIPAEAITQAGIEFFVEAQDSAGGRACAPKGFPCVTYSASVVPWPAPAVFLTQCRVLPRAGQGLPRSGQRPRPPARRQGPTGLACRRDGRVQDGPDDRTCSTIRSRRWCPPRKSRPAGTRVLRRGGSRPRVRSGRPRLAGAAGPRKDVPDTTPPGAVAGVKAEITGPYEVPSPGRRPPTTTRSPTTRSIAAHPATSRLGKDTLLTTTFKTEYFDCRVRAGPDLLVRGPGERRLGQHQRQSGICLG